jgi:pyruvate dehydrogenase E1 component alpha subunit
VDVADRAQSYAMPGLIVDGNDVEEVLAAVAGAAERARGGGGPTLLECKTYRHKGHSRSDPAKYRPAGELEEWLKRDPITLLRDRLLGDGTLSEHRAEELDRSARERVLAAEQQALADGYPGPEELLTHVYAR